jgi:4-hydroxy-2-oxoheptanedioate aldolase
MVRADTPEDKGFQGCVVRRNTGFVLEIGTETWIKSLREAVIAIMVEKESLVEQMDEVLSIEGLDMIQFGPCDFSVNVGRAGQMSSPEMQRKEKDVIELALKKGVHPRVEIHDFNQAQEFIEMGVRHFCIGWDLFTIYNWCKEQGKGLRKALGEGGTKVQ